MSTQYENTQITRRVLVHGLDYFGPALADFLTGDGWKFEYYRDRGVGNLAAMTIALRQCDLIYQIGGRVTIGKFLFAAKLLGKNRIVMHWTGTDTLDVMRKEGKSNAGVLNGIHHWAVSEWIQQEVSSLGIKCDLVPLPSTKIPTRPSPLPSEFSVLVYLPSAARATLYGFDMVLEVAERLPEIAFEVVGLREGSINQLPSNIRVHNRLPDLTEVYKRSSVVWRPTRHDGLSWMVMESLAHGRHVLWSYPFTGCIHATTAAEGVRHIHRLFQLHKEAKLCLNEEGAKFIASSEYYPWAYRKILLSRFQEILSPRAAENPYQRANYAPGIRR